jgi:amino acid adenylation domain-containing protein
MFVLQNTPRPAAPPKGIELAPVEVDSATAQFDLSLYLRQRDGKLIGYFEYASDLFDDSTIERMAGHFVTLLQSIVDRPERPVATLSMLKAEERRRLSIDWNNTAAETPGERTIPELFEAQARRTPDAVAVTGDGASMTYDELNARANRLAHYLRRCGVGTETPVALMVERSALMVVGLLGILKAGGAYVPLDPSYPEARLRYMLGDSQARVLITTETVVEDSGWMMEDGDPRLRLILLDRDWATIEQQISNNPKTSLAADNAAYVIYTSGSTGAPKGVVGLHRGALNRFAWMWRRYPFTANEVCCAKTSLSFVDSVWEIFGPLLQGVRVVMVPEKVARAPSRLVGFLAHHQVTRIVLVPSLLQALLDHCANLQRALPKLRLWTCSGEALSADLAHRFKSSHRRAVLLNLYGSAEVAADVTCFECRLAPVGAGVPIGRPIDNTQIHLLDAQSQPVPVGVEAELFVGGAGLARGYWRRPELSAEKFVANPFSSDSSSRLFRTGDRARYLPDGNIEYLGRFDRQIKIRGQRVEIGEVEATLSRHPQVRQCAVIGYDAKGAFAFQFADGKLPKWNVTGALLAYIVAAEGSPPSAAELRRFLRQTLPEFMVPASFITLDSLPLTPGGKLDRRSLPAPYDTPPPIPRTVVEPRTAAEKTIAAIWRELLQLKKVGVDDDFFALGGHSLLAATLVSRLSAAFARDISLRDFLAAPTVAAVAARVAGAQSAMSDDALPPIVPMPLRGELPLSSAQEQFLKLDELVSGAAFLHLPYAFRLNGRLDLARLRRSLQAIVNRHAVLRSVFVESRGRPVQVIRPSRKVACRLHDLSALLQQRQRGRWADLSRQDAERPFDLAKGPPYRFTVIRFAERRHILLVTLHHIIADQSSLRVLRADLAKHYHALARGRRVASVPLPFQFADFTRWQNTLLERGKLDGQIEYWRRELSDPPPRLVFQRGNKRPRAVSAQIARRTLTLDDALFAAVRRLARQRKTTPFIILLAALDVWLYGLTGCRDLRVGTLVANRNRPGTDRLIGYFVNAVVLRARLAPRMTFAELIEQARCAALGAFAHQDVPIEVLGRTLQKKNSRLRSGLYQVLVNYRRFGFNVQTVAGLTIASYSENERAAAPEIAFTSADLTVDFRELSTKLTVSVNFKVDLFDSTALDAMLASFSAVVEQAVALPQRRLVDIELPTAKYPR